MDKKIVGGNNIVEIFLQTEFQKHWAKDKEMTGIFHLIFIFLKKHETRPLCITSPAVQNDVSTKMPLKVLQNNSIVMEKEGSFGQNRGGPDTKFIRF